MRKSQGGSRPPGRLLLENGRQGRRPPPAKHMKGTLYHHIPTWVSPGSRFHIRIRMAAANRFQLTDPAIAPGLLNAANFYHERQRWFLYILVLMPDHLHGIMSFPATPGMSKTVGAWKAYAARTFGIQWQRNYFDHRLRNEDEFIEKTDYIRMNPIHAGLCGPAGDWPWVLDQNGLGNR